MRVSCPSCHTNYNIDEKRIPAGGAKLKCTKCQTTFPIKLDAEGGAVPLPGNGGMRVAIPLPNSAVPLPGSGAAVTLPNPMPSVPLPGIPSSAVPLPGSLGGAVRLPGPATPPRGSDSTQVVSVPGAPTGVVPLPGGRGPSISALSPEAVPLPGFDSPSPIASGAVPLPGSNLGGTKDPFAAFDGPNWENEATRVANIPLPSAAFREPPPDAVPTAVHDIHPGPAAYRTSESIPLPGADMHHTQPAVPAVAVPLPGGAEPTGVSFTDPAVPLPPPVEEEVGFADADLISEGTGSVPLPGSRISTGTTPSAPAFRAGSVPLPGGRTEVGTRPAVAAFDADGSVPLPGGKGPVVTKPKPAPPPPSFDFDDLPSPASEKPAGAEPTQAAVDFGALPTSPPPSSPSSEGFDLSDLPSPAQASPPPSTFDFADLPSPAQPPAASPVEIDFGDLPTPATQQVAKFDPSDLPMPSTPDLPTPAAAKPAPRTPAVDFGDVDFGEPAPASPRAAEPLEFDPLASARPAPKDDLEADLSAPPPSAKAPAGAADGLEMLSFIDDAAKATKAAPAKAKPKRYHIRRRSGKVFGPFDEGVVVKMLEDGQLLGNEDVSLDSENWSAIGAVDAFSGALQKIMESPTSGGRPATSEHGAPAERHSPQASQASMDRLKQLYEGRMAAVAVVDSRVESARRRRRIPFLIAGALAVLIIGGGLALQATPYGAFGLKKLLPAQVKQGTPEFADLQKARASLLADTFKSYSDALQLSEKVLRSREFPEVRALWCQAVFYLDRRYAAAKPPQLAQARAALESLQLLGEKNAEAVKAAAGDALSRKAPEEAVLKLEAAVARAPDDVELSLVLAEAYAAKHQGKQAADVLSKVLAKHKDSAKALHALGDIRQADRNADEAAKLYAQALEADPNHVSSAIELAAVELLVRKDTAKGKAALAKALDDKRKQLMGPAELAHAKALNGVLLEMQFKNAEAIAEMKEAQKLDPDSVFVKGRLGRALLDEGDFADALPLFQDAAKRDPLNLDYTDGYLCALLAAGKMVDAKTVVAAANTRFPGNARIAYLYGRVEDALDNTSEAEGHYRRALNADPKLYEPNLYLAGMYLRFKRFPDAKTELDAAEQKAPNVATVHSNQGQLAVLQNDLDRAQAEFKKAIELDPNHAQGHLGLSSVALARNNPADAKAEALKALELEPKVAGGRRQLGLALWKLGDLEGAIAELEKAKQDEPRSASVLLTIGAVRIDKADRGDRGELGIAEASISSALTLEPTNPESHFYMARVKNRRLEHTQAIENMRNALERAPNNPAYHYEMGVIFHDAKRGSDAIDEWNAALKLDPNYADPLEALGHVFLDRAEYDKAVDYFQKCMKIDPKRTRVLAAIGDAFFAAQKWDKAIERYQQALKADSTYAPAYYQIGRAYTERGDSSKAIDWYRRATAADPKNAQAYYYLAFAYKDRGLKADAVRAFKSYLAKRPEAEDKKEIEDEIYDLTQE
jgi:predicted Zn finger-like uncharacterized protein